MQSNDTTTAGHVPALC